jgi:hypothetical protein
MDREVSFRWLKHGRVYLLPCTSILLFISSVPQMLPYPYPVRLTGLAVGSRIPQQPNRYLPVSALLRTFAPHRVGCSYCQLRKKRLSVTQSLPGQLLPTPSYHPYALSVNKSSMAMSCIDRSRSSATNALWHRGELRSPF